MSERPNDPLQPQVPGEPQQPVQPYMPQQQAQPYMPQQPYEPQQPAQPVAQPYGYGEFTSQPYEPAQPQSSPYGTSADPYAYHQPVYGQPGNAYGQPSAYGSYPGPAPKSGKAVAALVCGILAILMGLSMVGSLFGIILGIVAIVLASSAVKSMGVKTGVTKAGKVCGIVGAILSTLSLLLTLAVGCLGLFVYDELSNISDEDLSALVNELEETLNEEGMSADLSGLVGTENQADSAAQDAPLLAGEGAESAQAAVEDLFDLLAAGDAALLQTVADMAEEDIEEQMGCSFADLGIDAQDYARWITEGLTYSVDMVVVDDSSNTATAYVDVYPRDVFFLLDNFDTALGAYMETDEYINETDEAALLLAVGDLFEGAMAATELAEPLNNYAMIGLTLENGEWVVSQEDWLFELDYMFGLA